MSNPYFSVGEEVILRSKYYPQYDGEYIVSEVIPFADAKRLSYEKGMNFRDFPESYHYSLDGLSCDVTNNTDDSTKTWHYWSQRSLRKKHKPSTDSFTEMMGNIKELVTQ